jgi:ribosomal protein S18 acetylase RimI-like enzyme
MTSHRVALSIKRADLSHVLSIIALEKSCFSITDRFSRKTWRHLLGPADKRGSSLTLIAVTQESATPKMKTNQPDVVIATINVLMRLQGHTARIYSLAVDPALRGQGVGGQLIRALPTHLPAQYHTLTLEVRAENSAARSLYDRLGFVVERMLPN